MVDFGNLISQPASFQRPQKSTPPSGGALHLKRGVCVILIILESLKRPRRMQSEFCGLTQFGPTAVEMEKSLGRQEDLQLYEIYA